MHTSPKDDTGLPPAGCHAASASANGGPGKVIRRKLARRGAAIVQTF